MFIANRRCITTDLRPTQIAGKPIPMRLTER